MAPSDSSYSGPSAPHGPGSPPPTDRGGGARPVRGCQSVPLDEEGRAGRHHSLRQLDDMTGERDWKSAAHLPGIFRIGTNRVLVARRHAVGSRSRTMSG